MRNRGGHDYPVLKCAEEGGEETKLVGVKIRSVLHYGVGRSVAHSKS